jgi:S1-C subfamily serine protease
VVGATAVVAALVGAVVGAAAGLGSQQTVVEKFFPNQSVLAHPADIQEILAKVEPAVVSIDTTVFSGGNGFSGQEVEGAGSGMILTSDGEVLTNNHVVAGATTVTVTLFGQTKALSAHVVGTDPSEDVALVQIDGQHGLPTVQLGDSADTRVGDSVVAIGNALALQGGPTVTTGIVSAQDRSIAEQNDITHVAATLTGLLQTDAAINSGNSGGPLVDSEGRVIGMDTAVAESSTGNAPAQNIGFAIAIDTIKPLLPGLLRGGTGGPGGGVKETTGGASSHTAYMGVVVENVTPSVAKAQGLSVTSGALVVGLTTGGPATRAGVKVGDVIVSVDGAPVGSAAQLGKDIASHSPGDKITVGISRAAATVTLPVILGSKPG